MLLPLINVSNEYFKELERMNAIQNFESQVGDLPVALTSDVVFKISEYVQTDHPEIFWFQYGLKVSVFLVLRFFKINASILKVKYNSNNIKMRINCSHFLILTNIYVSNIITLCNTIISIYRSNLSVYF